MLKYVESNVFNTDAEVIVNTINCVGFMGKGLALEYSLRYPELLQDYKEKCKNKEIKVGKMYYFKSKDKLIVNFPTKNDYKFPSELKWIDEGLQNFVKTYKDHNIKSIAFPLLGCNNGGLDYKNVTELMEKYLSDLDIIVYICLDKKNPEGKELEMIDRFNKCNIDVLANEVKLNFRQKEVLRLAQGNIQRFYLISRLDGIGFTTYRKIYSIFYNNINLNNKFEQQSLF